jgi:uncharacterized protein (TIGR03435 family)
MTKSAAIPVLVAACALLMAQPAIEVASIKPSDPSINGMNNRFAAKEFTLIGYAAKTLIENSLGMKDYQILNAPDWTRSERWTLEIKTTEATTNQQKFQVLLPALLADRYQFKYHRETRNFC